MESSRLIFRLKNYGADVAGIKARFSGDAALYEKCFWEFFEDPTLSALERAISDNEYDKAFEAAHALKGVTGNLGLTPLYQTVCILVESLRAKSYSNVQLEYEAIMREIKRLKIAAKEEKIENPIAGKEEPHDQRKKQQGKRKKKWSLKGKTGLTAFASLASVFIFIIVVVIGLLFNNLTSNFSNNVSVESSSHLEEINYQIGLYIKSEIETDWQSVYSIRNNLSTIVDKEDAAVYEYLANARDIWDVDDIIIYLEGGRGFNIDGERISNATASSTMAKANQLGEFSTIVQSTIIYTVPLDSELRIDGERVAAVSIERNLQTFLDNMDFSSFDGTADIYLTQDGGRVISKLSTENAAQTFNIMTLFDGQEISCISDPSKELEDMVTVDERQTYRMEGTNGADYVVVTPIETRQGEMRLFYIVPDRSVNETLNNFADDLTRLSVGVMAALAVIILVSFLIFYRQRKREFDEEIITRDRTFDLLVSNADTAFALLSTQQLEPIYISKNIEEIIGAELGNLVHTEDGFRLLSADGNETEARKEINQELRQWDGSGVFTSGFIARAVENNTQYYMLRFFPVADDKEEYVAIIQNATEDYNREEMVKNALNMAERANEAKSRFLSNMSHDIRTPMNAIVNMTKFAQESKDDPKALAECLDTIGESSDHLLRLINDVLDMSRIESGQAVIESTPFNIKAELKRLSDIVRSLCQNKNQTFHTEFDIRDHNVLGDRVKVSQILMNLLSNATKYTPEGGDIQFIATEIPSLRSGIVAMRFVVKDNGIGIPENRLKSVFDAFVRVDDRRVSKIEGTGLGLSICQSYVNAMGGSITCESVVGKGSTFTAELFFEETDIQIEEEKPLIVKKEHPFEGRRCLLCEDHPINQQIAKRMLMKIGFEVVTAANGQEGAERFAESEPGYYDVIYMDIQMPVMNGYEAATKIRKSAHPQAKEIPIIAMTANVFAEDVEKARLAGMNGHLGKPVNLSVLIVETDKLLNRNGA